MIWRDAPRRHARQIVGDGGRGKEVAEKEKKSCVPEGENWPARRAGAPDARVAGGAFAHPERIEAPELSLQLKR